MNIVSMNTAKTMKRLTKTEDNALSLYIGFMTFAACCIFSGHAGIEEAIGWLIALISSAIFSFSGMAERILHKLTQKSR